MTRLHQVEYVQVLVCEGSSDLTGRDKRTTFNAGPCLSVCVVPKYPVDDGRLRWQGEL